MAGKKKDVIPKPEKEVKPLLVVELERETKYLLNWIMIRRKINKFTNLFRRHKTV